MAADHAMPKRLGKYELNGILGKGAMGVVYNAWDAGDERRVAVKTIRLPDGGDNSAEEEYGRFKREAQAAGRLNHPGIVGIYGSGEADGIAYIAMELVEGQSLKALMDAEHRLTPPDAVRLMKELLDALAYSHACGVIHRDIKPSNIMVTPQGRLKITDFGIARIESSSMTQIGLVMGTPAYMSPEQFMGQTVDQRTDIYAAGVLLFQLLTGERPFEGGLTAIMHKVLHTVAPKPSELSVTAPEAFDAVVAKAMALRPEDRYPSAQAFSAALTDALAGGPALRIDAGEAAGSDSDETLVMPVRRQAASTPRAPTQAPPTTAEEKPRRLLVPVLAASAALLLVLGAGAYWLLKPGARPPETAPTIVAAPPAGPSAPAVVERTPPTSVPAPVAEAPADPQSSPAAPTPPASPTTASPAPMPAVPEPPLSRATEAPTPPPTPPVTAGDPAPAPAPIPAPVPAPTPIPVPVAEAGAQAQQAAVANVACTLLDVTIGADNRTVVTGLVGAGSPESAARAALATAGARAPTTNWAATRFDGPYCPVVDALRTVRSPNAPGFELGLRGGRTRLRNGETMAPIITAPPFPAYLQIAYFQSNRVVVHLFPAGGSQDKALSPGQIVRVGDPRTGGWPVGDPFGGDMMVAIMSSAPLPGRPVEEPSDNYLAAFERAAQQITREGGTISARAVPIQTYR